MMSSESRTNAAKKAWETRRANGWKSPKGKRAQDRERARQGYGAGWSDPQPRAEQPRAEQPRASEAGPSSGPFDTGIRGKGSVEDALRMLGVDWSAYGNREQLNRAFRKLMIANHPDRATNETERAERTAKCAGLSWAFHKLCPAN